MRPQSNRLRQIRRLLPDRGPAYELFDRSVYVLILAAWGYIFTTPTEQTETALAAPFKALARIFASPDTTWGALLSVVAIGCVGCAYAGRRRWLPRVWLSRGYTALIVAAFYVACTFLYGVLVLDGPARSFLSAVIYGQVASSLWRARNLEPVDDGPSEERA